MRAKGGYVYIMTNKTRKCLYIGATNNLSARTLEHKEGIGSVFTAKYKCTDLVYYECYECIEAAIEREKKLKKWRRVWKEELIKSINPDFRDLYEEVEGYD
ncbi:MAG: GIY-YIG nuclease family protein [Cytophagaceae bacterium]